MARDLGVPEHYPRLAVGQKRTEANSRRRGRLGAHLAIDECCVRRNFVYATVFSDPGRGVVIDMAPGRDASAVPFFASLFSHAERAAVRVVTIDCHAPYRMAVRVLFPNALVVADAFGIHRRVLAALTQVRRDAWNRWRFRSRRLAKVFKDARFGLARARDDLEADTRRAGERQRMAVFDATNLDAHLGQRLRGKEAFRVTMAIGRSGDVETFAAALDLFDALCRGSGIDAFITAAKTLRDWRGEILNHAASGRASNGFRGGALPPHQEPEAPGHGYRNWVGFRGQILWAFGEVIGPATGEIKALRSLPRGGGASWFQPQFAQSPNSTTGGRVRTEPRFPCAPTAAPPRAWVKVGR